MANKQRTEKWRRKLFWKRALLCVLAAVVAIGGLVAWGWYERNYATPAPSSPSPTASTESSSPSEPPPNPEAVAFSERSQEFVELYWSRDSSTAAERMKALAAFGEKSWLREVKKLENTPAYKAMTQNATRRTVIEALDQGSHLDGDTAETTVDVTIEEISNTTTEPIRINFTATVEWVYDPKTKTWLVSDTDPF